MRCPFFPPGPFLFLQRDTLWNARPIFALTLTYKFEQTDKCKVVPRARLVNGLLYEAALEGQMYQVGVFAIRSDDRGPRLLARAEAEDGGGWRPCPRV